MGNGELFLAWLFFGAVFFLIAELFGRSKHIGRYWSWALLWGCFVIPGIIAIIASPSAKKEPTKPNWIYTVFGSIFIFFALMFLVAVIKGYSQLTIWSSYGTRMLIRMQTGQLIGSAVLAFYLFALGRGSVRNYQPKYYFNKLHIPIPNSTTSSKVTNDTRYYIVVNGAKSEPLSIDDLRKLYVDPQTLVWRFGLESWKKAAEIQELTGYLNYQPPPLPDTEHKNVEIQNKDLSITEVNVPSPLQDLTTQMVPNEELEQPIIQRKNQIVESEDLTVEAARAIVVVFLLIAITVIVGWLSSAVL